MSKAQKKLQIESNKNSHQQGIFNLEKFASNLKVQILSTNAQKLQVSISGLDASLANALRRIMISQVQTMGLHTLLLKQNTSVLPDQLLVHRLGLLPISIDANNFQQRQPQQQLTEFNSLKFSLNVQCRRKQEFKKLTQQEILARNLKPEQYLQNHTIYSNSLKWVPLGQQQNKFKTVKLVHQNILIAKLRQGQQIVLDIYAEKGNGKRHSKFAPVSTAFYKLMPKVQIKQNFNHQKYAQTLVQACPVDVFKLSKNKAVVANQINCTSCRQCSKLDGIQLGKINDHFIFTIQSTGILSPQEIFTRALQILEEKGKTYEL